MPTQAWVPIGRRCAIRALAAVVFALAPGLARAQEPFHVTYSVDRGSGSGTARINGRVLNESTQDAFDVYVTAEAVDAAGKVLGRGLVFVSASIPPRGIAQFSISVPAAQSASSFRVRVSSFRQGIGQQQAG
jgi:hypothetical protein